MKVGFPRETVFGLWYFMLVFVMLGCESFGRRKIENPIPIHNWSKNNLPTILSLFVIMLIVISIDLSNLIYITSIFL